MSRLVLGQIETLRLTASVVSPRIAAQAEYQATDAVFSSSFLMEIVIDQEFKALIPPLADEERNQLEANIAQDGCRDPLVVWDGVLIDGHNRYEICTRLGIEFTTVSLEFLNRDEVMDWIDSNQLGRRNLHPDQMSLLRGRIYNRSKKAEGRPKKLGQNDPVCTGETAEKVAAKHGVSPATVKRDGKFAEAVERVSKAKPAIIAEVAAGKAPAKAAIVKAAAILEKQPEKAMAILQGGKTLAEVQREEKKAKQEEMLHARDADKARKTAKLKNSLFDVRRGDFRDVLQDIEGASLVLTDPPYPKDALHLWTDLGKWAANALAEDGLLVAYSGQLYLPQVLNNLSESLEYWWCGAVIHKGSGNLTPLSHPVRKVINCWKPLVMFYKRGGVGFERTFRDLVEGVGPQKTDHNWQQPVEEAKILIEAFTKPGELVVDPFAGSGGFCKAAHDLGRISVGSEILNHE